MRKIKEYALYKGDELQGIGTAKELAELTGVKVATIYFYKTPNYANRCANNPGEEDRKILIDLDDEEMEEMV